MVRERRPGFAPDALQEVAAQVGGRLVLRRGEGQEPRGLAQFLHLGLELRVLRQVSLEPPPFLVAEGAQGVGRRQILEPIASRVAAAHPGTTMPRASK